MNDGESDESVVFCVLGANKKRLIRNGVAVYNLSTLE